MELMNHGQSVASGGQPWRALTTTDKAWREGASHGLPWPTMACPGQPWPALTTTDKAAHLVDDIDETRGEQ